MAHRIIIAGIRRSGTHWQYNVVRLACEALAPGNVWAGQWDYYHYAKHPEAYHVVKIHHYCARLAQGALVLTSFRDLTDVQYSHLRMTGRAPKTRVLTAWLRDLLRWQQQAVHCTWYPHILETPREEITAILRALAMPLELMPLVAEQVQQLRPPPGPPDVTKRDPISLLFQGHITSRPHICTSA